MEQQATFKPRIRRQDATHFQVESKSRPGHFHTVDTLHLRCDCEAGQHGLRCWHLVWSLQAERLYKDADARHKTARKSTTAPLSPLSPMTSMTPAIRLEESAGYKALLEAF